MFVYGLCLILIILAADQISKWYILEEVFRPALLEMGADISDRSIPLLEWLQAPGRLFPPVSLEIFPFLNFSMLWNTGISFGFLADGALGGPMGPMALAGVITVFFTIWMLRSRSGVEVFALALVIGGAIGNMIDRLRFGAVADFLDVHVAGWHFPTFNIADACISIGVAILIIHGLFSKS